MSVFEEVNTALLQAMKARDESRLRALRGIKSAFLLAKTEKGTESLSDEKEIQVLQKMLKQRKESLAIYTEQNRQDLARQEAEEIAVIETFLPAQLDDDALRSRLQEIIARMGASGKKDMGRVMGTAGKELAGLADGRKIAQIVTTLLGE